MKSIILFLGLFFSTHLLAQIFISVEQGRTIFFVPENENNIIYQYSIDDGQFQKYEKTLSFKSKNDFKQFLSTLTISKNIQFHSLPIASKPLWPVKNNWSLKFEQIYSDWVRDQIKSDFYTSRKIVADCADVAYTLRWIFARIHYLPMKVTLAGTRLALTNFHFNPDWNELAHFPEKKWDQDPAFLASLKYLTKNTFTGTILNDTTFIKPSVDYIIPGMINHMPGHTQVINRVEKNITNDETPFSLIESTITSSPLKLMKLDYYAPDEMRQFDWATVSNGIIISTENPMTTSINPRLNRQSLFELFGFNDIDIYRSSVQTFVDFLAKRVMLVERGFTGCQKINCDRGTFQYDEFSTNSNDKRFFKTLKDFYNYFQELGSQDFVYNILATSPLLTLDNCNSQDFQFDCATFTVEGKKYNLKQMKEIFEKNKFSSDPRSPIKKRWQL